MEQSFVGANPTPANSTTLRKGLDIGSIG